LTLDQWAWAIRSAGGRLHQPLRLPPPSPREADVVAPGCVMAAREDPAPNDLDLGAGVALNVGPDLRNHQGRPVVVPSVAPQLLADLGSDFQPPGSLVQGAGQEGE
jgi:hypothetical protein